MKKSISDETVRLRLLRDILSHSPARLSHIGVAEMDDAALIPISGSESLVIASDFVRGSEFYLFQLGHMNYFDVGYYLVVANVSDIAAMGAEPKGMTTIVRYSKAMTDGEFCLVFQGIAAAAEQAGLEIVGGDIGGYRSDVFAATAFGFVETSKALLRSGARAGDLLCVTGPVGIPITALMYFKEMKPRGFRLSSSDEERLLASWRRPSARVRHGVILSGETIAHSCQDVSDGLKATIEQIGAASGVTFNVYADRLPIDDSTRELAAFAGVDAVQIAMSASVDFELVFTMPSRALSRCTEALAPAGLTYHVIGEVNDVGHHALIRADGSAERLPGETWRHQTGEYLKTILRPSLGPREHGSEESRH